MAMVTRRTLDRMLAKARFQMNVAFGLQAAFFVLIVGAGFLGPLNMQIGQVDAGTFIIIVTGLVWFLMMMRSVQQSQLMRHAAVLIGQGRAPQAVPFLAMTIEQFSVFRLPKLIALQHLMELAYARKDYGTSARLAAEIVAV